MDHPEAGDQEVDQASRALSPPIGFSREGLRHQVFVHLSILEDFSPNDFHCLDSGHSGTPPEEGEEYPVRVHFYWTTGVPDGEGRQPQRRPGDVHSRLDRRRDDKDDHEEDRDDRAGHAKFHAEMRARELGTSCKPPSHRGWGGSSR